MGFELRNLCHQGAIGAMGFEPRVALFEVTLKLLGKFEGIILSLNMSSFDLILSTKGCQNMSLNYEKFRFKSGELCHV